MIKKALLPILLGFSLNLAGQSWVRWPIEQGGNGHWYRLTTAAYEGWYLAETEAQRHPDGHLVSITSALEQNFLETTFLSGGSVSNAYWIGFNDFEKEGNWIWSTGDPTSYSNWASGEPNNEAMSEDGAVINFHFHRGEGEFGKWNDYHENRGNYAGLIESSAPLLVEVLPNDATAIPGSQVEFRIHNYNLEGPLAYQWYFNGTPIAGATNSTLLILADRADSGQYGVQVAGANGSVRSADATLLVQGNPPTLISEPANRVAQEGSTVSFVGSVESDTLARYSWLLNGARIPGATSSSLVLSNVSVAAAGTYTFVAHSEDGMVSSKPAKLTVVPAGYNGVYFNSMEGSLGSEWSNQKTSVTPNGQRRYLGNFGNEVVQLTLPRSLPVHTDVLLTFDLYLRNTWDGDDPIDGPDLFRLQADGTTLLNASFRLVTGSQLAQSYPGPLGGASYPSRTGAVENNSLGYGQDAVYHIAIPFSHSASQLALRFSGFGLESLDNESWGIDNVMVCVRNVPPGTAPVIVSAPRPAIVRTGESAMFEVTAYGTPPLRYQWRLKGENILGATNSYFVVTNCTVSDAGAYSVIAENNFGLVGRAPAGLGIVTSEPVTRTINSGGPGEFTLGFGGEARFQWSRDGVDMPNETNNVLSVNPLRPEDSGTYSVLAFNGGTPFQSQFDLVVPVAGEPGSLVWEQRAGGYTLRAPPALGLDKTVYLTVGGALVAIASDGTRKWERSMPVAFSAPTIANDGTIYVGGYNENTLFAVKPNADQKWAHPASGWFPMGSSLSADGVIYAPESGFTADEPHPLRAIKPDGSAKWIFDTPGRFISSPAIGADGTIYFGLADTNMFYALNSDKSLRWLFRHDGKFPTSPIIGIDGTIYFGTDAGLLYALSPEGALKWMLYLRAALPASPSIGLDNTLYCVNLNGILFAVTQDGAIKWKRDIANYACTSPAISENGTIYVVGESNYLYAIRQDGLLAWTFAAESVTYNPYEWRRTHPTLGPDGTIYYAVHEPNEVRLYAIKGDGPPASSSWPMSGHDAQRTGRMPLKTTASATVVSLGGSFTIEASTLDTANTSFQWWHENSEIAGATNRFFTRDHATVDDAGNYHVVMTYNNGTIKSGIAQLAVDTTFEKITTGSIVNDGGDSLGGVWGDYDADGWLDLFVANASGQNNCLYKNGSSGKFWSGVRISLGFAV